MFEHGAPPFAMFQTICCAAGIRALRWIKAGWTMERHKRPVLGGPAMHDSSSSYLVTTVTGERYRIRPFAPGDAAALLDMLRQCTPDDMRSRCLGAMKNAARQLADRIAHGQRTDIALVATPAEADGPVLGLAHIVTDRAQAGRGEFDVMVRSDLKGHGLGYRLMEGLLVEARARGIMHLSGDILAGNVTMLRMASELGFKRTGADGDTVHMDIALGTPTPLETKARSQARR
jgi:acetyltransferase